MYRVLPNCHFVSLVHQRHVAFSFSANKIWIGHCSNILHRAQPFRPIISDASTRSSKSYQAFNHYSNQQPSLHDLDPLILNSSDKKAHEPDFLSKGLGQGAHGDLSTQSHFAILGGGISGLVTAHYIIRKIPNVKVTLYESQNRLGGWIQSEYVDVEKGMILLESGPRTLRYGTTSSLTVAELVSDNPIIPILIPKLNMSRFKTSASKRRLLQLRKVPLLRRTDTSTILTTWSACPYLVRNSGRTLFI